MKWLKSIFDKRYAKISLYVIITAVIINGLNRVADDAPTIIGWIWLRISWLMGVLKPVVLGFILAYLTNPVIKFFEKRLQKVKILQKKARGISVIITLLIIIAAIVGIISTLVFSVTDQVKLANWDDALNALKLMINSITDFSNSVLEKLESMDINSTQIAEAISTAADQLFEVILNGFNGVFSSLQNVSGYFTTIAFGVIIGIYFMLDGKMITTYLNRVTKAIFSEHANARIHEFLNDLHSVFSGYLQGQLSDVLFMMIAISITLSITGVKFGVMIGILAGLGNLIPYCGPFIAYGLTALVCLVNGQYNTLIISVIALFIIQAIDGNFIGPKLLSRSIQIHPLLVIVFLIFGSAIGGLAGMLLAVPVGGFIKVLFNKWLERIERQKGIIAESVVKEPVKKEPLKKERVKQTK